MSIIQEQWNLIVEYISAECNLFKCEGNCAEENLYFYDDTNNLFCWRFNRKENKISLRKIS